MTSLFPTTPAPQILRDYQRRALDDIRARLVAGVHRVLLVAPTGSGKTTIAAEMIRGAVAKEGAVLFLAHRKELVDQCSARLDSIGVDHGVLMAQHRRTAPWCPVQVASVPTLVKRLDKLPRATLVIVDEAHHARASTYAAVLSHYPTAPVIGLSATPWRLDNKGLGELFQDTVVAATPRQLIDDGYLVPYTGYAYDAPQLDQVKKVGADYNQHGLELVMSRSQLAGNIVEQWLQHCSGRRTAVFCVTVKHSQDLVQRFRAAGVAAEHLDGTTPTQEREGILARLASNATQVVCNVNVLCEGWDLPELEVCVLARPTLSVGLFLQMCLDAQTEILTRRGWMGPDAIRDDDLVAAFDRASEAVTWEPILSHVDRALAPGESMYGLRSPGADLRITDGHQLVYRTTSRHLGWRTATAAQVAQIRHGFELPVAALEESTGVSLTDDELRFIGWFLTDGSLNKVTNAISIYQAENQPHLGEIEKCLKGCGFKYGIHARWPEGPFKASARRIQFTISKGPPRGRDKHLRGWVHLERFIDKTFSPELENISTRQLGVLLEAMHLGDGFKQAGQSWTRRSYHITSSRKLLVDRLQSLCVRRGWRCNVARASYNVSPLYVLHIKPVRSRWVGGRGSKDRQYLRAVESEPGERVWCVENRLGTLFTRRNGKVAIVGNCGRGMRPAPGKTMCRIHDHAGCILRHGVPDAERDYSLTLDPRKSDRLRLPPVRTCKACFAIYAASLRTCPACGYEHVPSPRELREVTKGVQAIPLEQLQGVDVERHRYLEKQVAEAQRSGKKLGWAAWRYKEKYGEWPPPSWWGRNRIPLSADRIAQLNEKLKDRLRGGA